MFDGSWRCLFPVDMFKSLLLLCWHCSFVVWCMQDIVEAGELVLAAIRRDEVFFYLISLELSSFKEFFVSAAVVCEVFCGDGSLDAAEEFLSVHSLSVLVDNINSVGQGQTAARHSQSTVVLIDINESLGVKLLRKHILVFFLLVDLALGDLLLGDQDSHNGLFAGVLFNLDLLGLLIRVGLSRRNLLYLNSVLHFSAFGRVAQLDLADHLLSLDCRDVSGKLLAKDKAVSVQEQVHGSLASVGAKHGVVEALLDEGMSEHNVLILSHLEQLGLHSVQVHGHLERFEQGLELGADEDRDEVSLQVSKVLKNERQEVAFNQQLTRVLWLLERLVGGVSLLANVVLAELFLAEVEDRVENIVQLLSVTTDGSKERSSLLVVTVNVIQFVSSDGPSHFTLVNNALSNFASHLGLLLVFGPLLTCSTSVLLSLLFSLLSSNCIQLLLSDIVNLRLKSVCMLNSLSMNTFVDNLLSDNLQTEVLAQEALHFLDQPGKHI